MYALLALVINDDFKGELRIIWQFFYNNFLAYILFYLQSYLINRYMPQESLGQFSYAQSMLMFFCSVYSMEVYSAYLRFIGVNSDKSLLQITRRTLSVASLLFGITVIWYFKSPIYLLFFAYMWMFERLYFFRAKLDIKTYGLIKILQHLISVSILVWLIMLNQLNEKTMLFALGVSYGIVALLYNFNGKARQYTDIEANLPSVPTKDILRYCVPMSFNAIVIWLLGAADQMLINIYLDPMTLTYYSVAFRVIAVIRLGVGIVMEYWPRFYFESMVNMAYEKMRTMKVIFLCFVILLCGCSVWLSAPLYHVMGASQYVQARWMFSMLAIAEAFRVCGSILITYQAFIKNTIINIACLSILSSGKLLVNWLFINQFGVRLLLYTTITCYVLYFICALFFGVYKERKYIYLNPASGGGK